MKIYRKYLSLFLLLLGIGLSNLSLLANETQLATEKDCSELIESGDSLLFQDSKEALRFYNLAFEKYGDRKDSLTAKMFNQMGTAFYISGEYHEALDWYYNAYYINEAIDNKTGIAIGLNNIGVALTANGDNEKAIEKHLESLEISKNIGDSMNIARNYYNMGISYSSLNQLKKAKEHFEDALAISITLAFHYQSIQIYNQLGQVNRLQKNYQNSINYHLKVIENPVVDIEWEKSFAYSGLAACYFELGLYRKSIAFADSGMVIAKKANVKFDIYELSLSLAKAHAAEQNFSEAYAYMTAYTALHDSIWNEKKEKEINKLQLQHSEDLRLELEKNNHAQLELIENKNYLLIAAGILLLILLSLFFNIYRSYQYKSKTNRKLEVLNNEIRSKNTDLKALNRSRDKLVSVIAHDLKSPYNSLLGFSRILEKDFDKLSEAQQKQYIRIIHNGLENSFVLLENLLIWSNSQGGHINFEPELENLFLLSKETLEAINISAESKSIKINIDIPVGIEVETDKGMFKAIIRNLLTNAIKFTPEKGDVLLAIDYENKNKNSIIAKVKDTGTGIPEDIQKQLFSTKETTTTRGTANESGTGLGLNICHDFVKIHGGDIWVESELDKGSTFYFSLPVKQDKT